MSDVVSYRDHFVICSGRNTCQTQGIVAEIWEAVKRDRILSRNIYGERQGDWILLDYLDVYWTCSRPTRVVLPARVALGRGAQGVVRPGCLPHLHARRRQRCWTRCASAGRANGGAVRGGGAAAAGMADDRDRDRSNGGGLDHERRECPAGVAGAGAGGGRRAGGRGAGAGRAGEGVRPRGCSTSRR